MTNHNGIQGIVKVTFTSNQYVYEYTENNNEETIGGYLYENASSQANLKANKGIYKGSNPDNYLQYNGRLWRIMKINSDNSLKIVANEATTKLAWNDSGNAKFSNASINTYLNNTFYNALTNKENVQSVSWCNGNLDNACGETYTANIGLISTDDYALASNALGCNKN